MFASEKDLNYHDKLLLPDRGYQWTNPFQDNYGQEISQKQQESGSETHITTDQIWYTVGHWKKSKNGSFKNWYA